MAKAKLIKLEQPDLFKEAADQVAASLRALAERADKGEIVEFAFVGVSRDGDMSVKWSSSNDYELAGAIYYLLRQATEGQ